MKNAFLPVIGTLAFAVTAFATDANQDSTKKPTTASPAVTETSGPNAAVNASTQGTPTPATPTSTQVAATPATTPPKDPTVLPQVEVNKSRITNIDIEISEKQRAIDFEKQKTKPTRLDESLNNSKVAKSLSIFGGSSSDSRSGLAKERVSILEEEKEILEAMKTAQTKEEKEELKKELELLRQQRRELDQGGR